MRAAPERGQILVIVAAAMVVIVGMVGLVVDVGYAWGQQRDTQNGNDAAAHAGAIVLLDRYAGGTEPNGGWDWAVHQAVQSAATENGITAPFSIYTDWQGIPLSPEVIVGPSDGLAEPPPEAQGVEVMGSKTFQPFIAQILGFTSFTANTTATAVAGNSPGPCELEDCILLPIAFPATMIVCSETGHSTEYATNPDGTLIPWPDNTEVIMPLCGGNPGSVGWIDWTPQETTDGCTGTGTAEIICHVEDPPIQDIAQPSWQLITATGGPSSQALEDALNEYAGQIVLLPLFDSTCDEEPTNPELDGCPPEHVGGHGVNQWYHVPKPGFAAFRFDYPKGAYTNGHYSDPCGLVDAQQCLVGTFVRYVSTGSVGPPDPDSRDYSVQLVR